jgi:endogenous inhibitor of DNA gyrase (YacG/DUF329 family)
MTPTVKAAAACVICKKPSDPAYSPFCSKRCADVDLQRWLTGGYVIPGADPDDEEDGASASADQG